MIPISDDDKKGASAQAMKAAPPNSVYVVHNSRQRGWFEALRIAVERPDIELMVAAELDLEHRIAGRRPLPVVVDHWCEPRLTDAQRRGLEYLRALYTFGETMDRVGK